MRRLIWGFAGRTYHIVGNLMSRLIYKEAWCYWNHAWLSLPQIPHKQYCHTGVGGNLAERVIKGPPTKTLVKFLLFLLKCNHFVFSSKHYLLGQDTSIRDKKTPAYANMFILRLEKQLSTSLSITMNNYDFSQSSCSILQTCWSWFHCKT